MNLQKKQPLERALELKGYWVCLCCPNPHIRRTGEGGAATRSVSQGYH